MGHLLPGMLTLGRNVLFSARVARLHVSAGRTRTSALMPSALIARIGGRLADHSDDPRWWFIPRFQETVLRKNTNLPDLSRKTGIPLRTLRAWNAGERSPRVGDPRRIIIARALGRSIAWMNGFDKEASSDARAKDRDE